MGVDEIGPPRRTVVHQHTIRQAVGSENTRESPLHRSRLLVTTGLQSQSEARVVIQDRQRVTTPTAGQREVALEVHLPQQVGAFMFKACVRSAFGCFHRIDAAVSPEDGCDGTGGWHVRLKHIFPVQEPPSKLTSSPTRMGTPCLEQRMFHFWGSSCRRVKRPSRLVQQTTFSTMAIPPQPLVASRMTYPKTTAQLSNVGSFGQGQANKLFPLGHDSHLLPRHEPSPQKKSCPLWCKPCPRTCVSYVSRLNSQEEGERDGRPDLSGSAAC